MNNNKLNHIKEWAEKVKGDYSIDYNLEGVKKN
jgi:hypothetical protein